MMKKKCAQKNFTDAQKKSACTQEKMSRFTEKKHSEETSVQIRKDYT